MAHFAEVDKDPLASARETDPATVLRVIVVSDEDCTDNDGRESEEVGAAFCADMLGGYWVQTSYNGNVRHNYAGEGALYDGTGFFPEQTHPSWTLDENYLWQAPIPYPDGGLYFWDEESQSWIDQKPFPSWTWDEATQWYDPPVAAPEDFVGDNYDWDEETLSWVAKPSE
jgi:hypothetical protein